MNKFSVKKLLITLILTVVGINLFLPLGFAADIHSFDLNQLNIPGQQTTLINTSTTACYSTVNGQTQQTECNSNPVAMFIVRIINLIIAVSGSVSFLGIIVGGFYILTSGGNTTRSGKGKEIITYAITGLVISLSAYFIVAFVQGLLFSTGQ